MKRSKVIFYITLIILFAVLAGDFKSQSIRRLNSSDTQVHLQIEQGWLDNGAVSLNWIEALNYLRRTDKISQSDFSNKPLAIEEIQWKDLILKRKDYWQEIIDSLRIPFANTKPPGQVKILIGNQGGEDAFTFSDSTICFDLARLNFVYGSSTKTLNTSRIDRFFAHEFTHVLYKAWKRDHEIVLKLPFDVALWECLVEGLGNYRSLSSKWLNKKGTISDYASLVLTRLQPVFADRISSLANATNEQADSLLEGLSMGKFDEKWGALTIALWLKQETRGNDILLCKWVETGPKGILILAEKYLPDNLYRKISESLNN